MVFLRVCSSEYFVDIVVFPVMCAGFCRWVLRLYLTDSDALVRSGSTRLRRRLFSLLVSSLTNLNVLLNLSLSASHSVSTVHNGGA